MQIFFAQVSQVAEENKSEKCTGYQIAFLAGGEDCVRQLGVCFFKGFCTEKDHKRAVEFWQMELPQRGAFFDLAQYFEGSHVPDEDQKSFGVYLRAAELKYPKGEIWLWSFWLI